MEQQNAQAVHMKDIAKAVGISRQAVYLHFASRADLLVATTIYMEEALGLNERIEQWRMATSGVELLETFVELLLNHLSQVYGVAKALIAVYETDEAAAEAWDGRLAAIRDGCHTTIKALAHDNMLAPEWTLDTATDLLVAMLSVENLETLTKKCGWSAEETVSRMQVAVRRIFVREN